MSWQDELSTMELLLGDSPSEEQQENLLNWVVYNTPRSYWRSIADNLHEYSYFSYGLIEICAEVGI